jgi:hypothetical protein
MIAKGSLVSSVIAIAILVSVATRRPLMSEGPQAAWPREAGGGQRVWVLWLPGAGARRGMGWAILEKDTDPPRLDGDYVRDETEQVRYLTELNEIFLAEGVDLASGSPSPGTAWYPAPARAATWTWPAMAW